MDEDTAEQSEVSKAPSVVYYNALKEKERLESVLREASARLAEVNLFIMEYCRFSPELAKGSGVSQKEFEDIAVEILSEAGRPLSRDKLRDALRTRRVYIGGTNPEKNFGAKLWKAATRSGGKLTYDKDVGYRIRESSNSQA